MPHKSSKLPSGLMTPRPALSCPVTVLSSMVFRYLALALALTSWPWIVLSAPPSWKSEIMGMLLRISTRAHPGQEIFLASCLECALVPYRSVAYQIPHPYCTVQVQYNRCRGA
ncbi:hypothetical protein F5884DRAFT_768494 [Xylogone sp. PMI_703]|nr:hypothetical protein F5884DRAFT_768494 [Xylogone sp. PMI_703]